jgi:hypothetical protein
MSEPRMMRIGVAGRVTEQDAHSEEMLQCCAEGNHQFIAADIELQ